MRAFKVIIIALIFLTAQGGFLLHLGDFAFAPGGEYSDVAISHYPNAILIKQSLLKYGEIPLWSNSILSGYPFMADPLSGIHYPFGWIALIFPLPLGFNILLSLHLVFGAFGFYFFFRQKGYGEILAILGGVSFILIPRLWAHLAAGHLTMIYAVCWTPWLLLTSSSVRMRERWLPGLVLGMIILADIRWAGYIAIPWLGFIFYYGGDLSGKINHKLKAGLKIAFQGVVGILIGAVLVIPLFELTQLSTRANLSAAERTVFSLPPQQLFGLLFPDFFGYVEWILYPGALLILAYLWSWLQPDLRRQTRFLRWAILLIYLFSIGSNSVFTAWMFQLPIFAFLRVPARLILIGNVYWIVLLIQWIDYLVKTTRFDKIKAVRLGMAGLCGIMASFTAVVWSLSPANIPVNLLWGCILCGAVCAILFRHVVIPWKNLPYLCLGVVLVDLAGVNYLSVTYHTAETVLNKNQEVAEFLSNQDGIFRIYSPSYSIPQQVAAGYGLQLSDGINPLQLKTYVEFMKTAVGIESDDYSVTLPPFKTGDPKKDNQGVNLDTVRLGMLNVRYIVAEFNIPNNRLKEIRRFGTTRLYENLDFLSRAWISTGRGLTQIVPINDNVIEWSSNRISVNITGSGALELSEVTYPGWSVRVDGQPAELLAPNNLLRLVWLNEGNHQVQFEFIPASFYAGLIISCLAMVVLSVRNWRKCDR